MTNELVSIVTPVYNASQFIEKTVRSVLKQTYQNLEMILVDDCSTDDSKAVIQKLIEEDNRIKYYRLDTNSGAAVARNKGIELAKGSFISFIDSDDYWHPEKTQRQMTFMKENGYAFTYTGFETITEDGDLIKKVQVPDHLDYSGLLKNTAIACSTVLINRDEVGDFRMPLVRKGQDTATWLYLLRERVSYAYGLNEVLSYYRQVEGSISSDKIGALKRTWNTYYNIEKLPFWKASYYFVCYVLNALLRRI